MDKQYRKSIKKAVKQVAKEALDVVISERKRELEESRREKVRLNRGHDATWAEAKYASEFEDAVFKEIEKLGVNYEDDLIIPEQLAVNKVVSTRAKDHAFTWASRVAQEEAAAQHKRELAEAAKAAEEAWLKEYEANPNGTFIDPELDENKADTDYEEHVRGKHAVTPDEVRMTTEGSEPQENDHADWEIVTVRVYPANVTVDESYNKVVANWVAEKIKRASEK